MSYQFPPFTVEQQAPSSQQCSPFSPHAASPNAAVGYSSYFQALPSISEESEDFATFPPAPIDFSPFFEGQSSAQGSSHAQLVSAPSASYLSTTPFIGEPGEVMATTMNEHGEVVGQSISEEAPQSTETRKMRRSHQKREKLKKLARTPNVGNDNPFARNPFARSGRIGKKKSVTKHKNDADGDFDMDAILGEIISSAAPKRKIVKKVAKRGPAKPIKRGAIGEIKPIDPNHQVLENMRELARNLKIPVPLLDSFGVFTATGWGWGATATVEGVEFSTGVERSWPVLNEAMTALSLEIIAFLEKKKVHIFFGGLLSSMLT